MSESGGLLCCSKLNSPCAGRDTLSESGGLGEAVSVLSLPGEPAAVSAPVSAMSPPASLNTASRLAK